MLGYLALEKVEKDNFLSWLKKRDPSSNFFLLGEDELRIQVTPGQGFSEGFVPKVQVFQQFQA